MKSVFTLLVLICILLLSPAALLAQVAGDYASNGTGGGNWNAVATWQVFNGSSWGPAGTPPAGSESITIQLGDSVYIDVPVSIANKLANQGKLGGTGNLTIAGGGTFEHAQDGGSLPRAVWSSGSTLRMTGPTGVSPDNRNQSFYNVTFDTPGLLSNLNMGWDSITIGGDIRVINTGSARWQMTGPTAGDSSIFSIMGDIIVTGGQFTSNGTSNANTKIEVHHYGDIIVTGGNLSVSRGSQGSGSGSTRWYLHEGDFSMTNATTQNSNPTNAWFVFDKPGVQTLTLGAGNTLTSLPIEVRGGTTLDMGLSKLRGSGIFRVLAGGTVATANEGGLDSAVAVGGTVTLNQDANFTFNGTTPQVTGSLLPATLADLTIDNPTTVTLTQFTTINDTLHLRAGIFDAGVGYALGPNGVLANEGGTIVAVEESGTQLPLSCELRQNYPNPFNPSTSFQLTIDDRQLSIVRVYDLLGREVATVLNDVLEPGTHTVTFDASGLAGGMYIYRLTSGGFTRSKTMVLLK